MGGPATIAHFGRLAARITGQRGARLPGVRRLGLREAALREGLTIQSALVAEIANL